MTQQHDNNEENYKQHMAEKKRLSALTPDSLPLSGHGVANTSDYSNPSA